MLQRSIKKITFLVFTGLLVVSFPAHAAGEKCGAWPDWNSFRQKFVSEAGRVIDRSVAQQVTTSEGQSYALMFALIANDRATFDLILRWTEDNLADGDLTGHLPAWQWGKRADDSWGVIDGNTASDADLWLAYALNEAGLRWNVPRYTALAELVADRILREETAEIPGLGLTLLPGQHGFHPDASTWRLNPSYLPVQVMRRFAMIYPRTRWKDLIASSIETVTQSAPQGYVPEWVSYQAGKGFVHDRDPDFSGVGFNAIRVYLWAGMLDHRDKAYPVLLKQLAPMGRHVANNIALTREVHASSGVLRESASAGFSSALLPFLKAARLGDVLHQQQQRIVALAPMDRSDNYYDQVLTLFGLGWLEGRYRFDRHGQLIPGWKCTKN